MMCSFLFFLLHPLFFLLSRKVSHFTLSHIWRYTGVQERSRASLGMTIRGKRLSKHVRCTKRRISIPRLSGYAPHTVISNEVEKSFFHSVLPCPFRGRLPILLCHTYGAIPVCQKDPSASLGMTIRGKRRSKHARCTKRRISIPRLSGYAPHTVISSVVEKSFSPLFLVPFTEDFPFHTVTHTALYQCAKFESRD